MSALSYRMRQLREIDVGDIPSWPYWLKVAAVVMVGVIALTAFALLMYSTKLAQMRAHNQTIESLKQQLVSNHEQSVNLPLYIDQMREIEQRFKLVSGQLPNKTEIPALLADISQAGIDNGLQFVRFQPGPHQQQDFFVKVPIQIKAIGSYHELASFVSDMANFQRIVNIGDFTISRNKQSEHNEATRLSQEPLLELSAEVFTYHYQGDDAPLPAADKPRVVRPGLVPSG